MTTRPESVGMCSRRLARIDRFLADAYVTPGKLPCALLQVARDGQLVHQTVLGHACLETGTALADDTIVRIYSMTKPITSVAFMMGLGMLALVALYQAGSILHLKPLRIRKLQIAYPKPGIAFRQLFAAPIEIIGAAGIIYFALPDSLNPGFFVVLGMFLDGLPLYQTAFGTYLTDPFMLEQVEVLKGPASVLYGGASVGGIVNMVSKRPTGERLRYTEAGVNNFGNAYGAFDIGDGNEDGSLAYRLTGKVSGGGWETKDAKDLQNQKK